MRGDLLGRIGKQQARCITARRSLPAGRDRNLRSRFAPLQAPFPLAAGRDRNLRSRFAPLQAPFPLAAGALQNCGASRSCAARRAAIPFWGSRPRESKLSTAWPPKRNQHRFCDADSLIMNVLRRDRDSNPRYPFGVYTLSRRAS